MCSHRTCACGSMHCKVLHSTHTTRGLVRCNGRGRGDQHRTSLTSREEGSATVSMSSCLRRRRANLAKYCSFDDDDAIDGKGANEECLIILRVRVAINSGNVWNTPFSLKKAEFCSTRPRRLNDPTNYIDGSDYAPLRITRRTRESCFTPDRNQSKDSFIKLPNFLVHQAGIQTSGRMKIWCGNVSLADR